MNTGNDKCEAAKKEEADVCAGTAEYMELYRVRW